MNMARKFWTEEEIDLLYDDYDYYCNNRGIAEKDFNCCWTNIHNRAVRMGLKIKEKKQELRVKNTDDWNKYYRNYHKEKLKKAAIYHYSHGTMCCTCCGESHIEFLTIDHINGGGRKHRIEEKINSIYQYLKNKNYPEGYQILCFNCNCSKGFFGYCPHQLEKK